MSFVMFHPHLDELYKTIYNNLECPLQNSQNVMPRLNSPSPIDLSDWWKMQKLTQKLQSFMHFSVNARSWVVSTACCTRNILNDSDGGIRFQSSNDDSSQHLGKVITWTLRSQHSYLLRMETQLFFHWRVATRKAFQSSNGGVGCANLGIVYSQFFACCQASRGCKLLSKICFVFQS